LAYVALLFLGALDAVGYSIIAPVVPEIADRSGAGPTVMGALVATFALGQLAGYPLAGAGVKRRNASAVLAVALVAMLVGDLGFVLSDELEVLFPARFLMGLGAGGLWMGVAFATLERFPGQEYQRMTGILAAYAVGSIAGPALGGIGGIRGPFLAHLGLVLLGSAVVATLGAPRERPGFDSDRNALRSPGFWLASAGVTLVAIGLATLEGPLPLHFSEELSQAGIAGLYVGGAVVAAVSAVAAGKLPPRPTLAVSAVALVLGVGLAGASESVPLWFLAVALAGIGIGAGESAALGILLETTGTARIVTAMVIWSQIWAIGYLAAPVGAGAVAETIGFGLVGLIPLAGALLVAAAFLAAPRRMPEAVRSRP
jgi:MFS family permease